MRSWLVSLGLALTGAGIVLVAVIALGRWAVEQLRDQDRYTVAFADIACTPPPGQAREDFLGEVQYLAGWPDRLRLLDNKLPRQLTEVFIQHPWVERVDKVEIAGDGIHVSLTYRVPVLALSRPGPDGPLRAVDGGGVLLPLAAVTADLPLFDAVIPSGAVAGVALKDPRVQAAACTAALVRQHQLTLKVTRVAMRGEEIHLESARGRIVWGHPPGEEVSGEEKPEHKISRLLEWNERGEGECDLRK